MSKYEQGKCPYCGSENLSFIDSDFENDEMCYTFECDECGGTYSEIYELTFKDIELGELPDEEEIENNF